MVERHTRVARAQRQVEPRNADSHLAFIGAGLRNCVTYVNRPQGATTGAWPGIQTFCGWKGSGVTNKGGLGPFYVPQFMREQSRTLFGTL